MHKGNLFRRAFGWYFNKRVLPYWAILITDTLIVFLSALLTYWVTDRTFFLSSERSSVFLTALFYAILSWIGARIFRTYSGVMRYSSSIDLLKLGYANLVSMVLALISWALFRRIGVNSLTALTPLEIVIVFVIAAMLMWALRIVVKSIYESIISTSNRTRVLIYGAMTGGVGMAKSLGNENPVRFELRGFISHENRIRGMKLMGVPVYTLDDGIAEVVRKDRIRAVVVSPYRVKDFRNNQKIQNILIEEGCKIYMAQDAKEAQVKDGVLSNEEMNLQISEVTVEDLLPRQEIRLDLKSVEKLLKGKRVLITGSGGSIGMEIVRQVARFKPEKMMLIDQAETPQHDVRLMMAKDFPDIPCEVVVTSVSRRTRMEHVFKSFQPEYVFHAAAYKHVPMMEDNPSEAILNNVYGTKIIADLSVEYGVKKFVMISTDKAVNPTSVMGCSKRICEIYVLSLDRKLRLESLEKHNNYTQFVTTRFGNVMGSSGSVIPLFREQIKNGGPVTVTDERIVRYFMLIPEACKLVLEACTMGNGGDLFVFDMGQPVRIADLAKRMIALSNAKNVKIEYTGLREGEKLYEEVLNSNEVTKPTFHEKIRIAQVREYDYEEVSREIDELVEIAKQFDDMETVRKMKAIVPEYKSSNSVYEAIDEEIRKKVDTTGTSQD